MENMKKVNEKAKGKAVIQKHFSFCRSIFLRICPYSIMLMDKLNFLMVLLDMI